MRKRAHKPSALYDHKAHKMLARHLNLPQASDVSGRSSYSYTTFQAPVRTKPLAEHEHFVADTGNDGMESTIMDIDEDIVLSSEVNVDEPDEDAVSVNSVVPTITVIPGITEVTKPKERTYENSVSSVATQYDMNHMMTHAFRRTFH